MNCTVADNYIQCDTNENLADSNYWTRAIYFFICTNAISKTSGNSILRNRVVGRYHPAIYVSGKPAAGGFENNLFAVNVLQCDDADKNCSPFLVNFYGTNNPANGRNYLLNNTINYPSAWGYLSFPRGITGYWTIENNIIVSGNAVVIISDFTDKTHFVFNYNNYYCPGSGAFCFVPFSSWRLKYPSFDANSYFQNPLLNSSSALTIASPITVKGGSAGNGGIKIIRPGDPDRYRAILGNL